MAAQIHAFPVPAAPGLAPGARMPARTGVSWRPKAQPKRGIIIDLDDTLYPRERFELDAAEVTHMLRVFRTHDPSLWLPYESGEALRRLRADGWRIAILTNGLPSVQAAKVAALAVAPMVDQVVYADAVVPGGKPAPEAFAAALELLDVPASRCVMVGDDPAADIDGGRAAGLRTVRLTRPGVTVTPGHEADVILYDIHLLPSAARAALDMVTLDVA